MRHEQSDDEQFISLCVSRTDNAQFGSVIWFICQIYSRERIWLKRGDVSVPLSQCGYTRIFELCPLDIRASHVNKTWTFADDFPVYFF